MNLTRASRLPESDRAEMRAMRESKPWLWSYEALAQYFGTTRWTAMNVCKGEVRYQPDDYDRIRRDEFMQGEML